MLAGCCSFVKGSLMPGRAFSLLSRFDIWSACFAAAWKYPLADNCALQDWLRNWPKYSSIASSLMRPTLDLQGSKSLGFVMHTTAAAQLHDCRFCWVCCAMKQDPFGRPQRVHFCAASMENRSKDTNPLMASSQRCSNDNEVVISGATFIATWLCFNMFQWRPSKKRPSKLHNGSPQQWPYKKIAHYELLWSNLLEDPKETLQYFLNVRIYKHCLRVTTRLWRSAPRSAQGTRIALKGTSSKQSEGNTKTNPLNPNIQTVQMPACKLAFAIDKTKTYKNIPNKHRKMKRTPSPCHQARIHIADQEVGIAQQRLRLIAHWFFSSTNRRKAVASSLVKSAKKGP